MNSRCSDHHSYSNIYLEGHTHLHRRAAEPTGAAHQRAVQRRRVRRDVLTQQRQLRLDVGARDLPRAEPRSTRRRQRAGATARSSWLSSRSWYRSAAWSDTCAIARSDDARSSRSSAARPHPSTPPHPAASCARWVVRRALAAHGALAVLRWRPCPC